MNSMSKPTAIRMPIPFIDLQAQRRRLGESVNQGMRRVLDHGQFIMGPEVPALETALSAFCGAHHVIGCANGTDALNLAMRALGIGPGDAVIVPAFSFSASAEAVRQVGLNPRAVMPVDLFGLPADYAALDAAAAAHGMLIIADAAQSFGASRGNRQVGTFGHIAATSFFPSKPLGCYGDGGAVFTADAETASLLR